MAPPAASESAVLQQLLAGQGATDQRFEEIFRRLDKAENTAGEARDVAREIVTILREQNALEKITEVRSEARNLVADLRADVVAANKVLRDANANLEERVQGLEDTRTAGFGAMKGAKLAWEMGKLVAAMGGGALLIKLFGG